ncbi:7186_t:CDS:2 [Entrophospora sp. SA101]|nr:7186_t:CDS:2 [Entrophospora sp. SA101]CAJ0907336.1 8451_t:CDS:2 [Entrophospora sp. SA101]
MDEKKGYLNDFVILEGGDSEDEEDSNNNMTAISDIFGPYTSIIKKVCNKCERILKYYDSFQDKSIKFCGILVDCVDFMHFNINHLTRSKEENLEKFKQATFYQSFNRFEIVLNSIEKFIYRISDYGIVRNFYDLEHVKKNFYEIVDDLELVCKGLQFNNMTIFIFQQIKENKESLDNHFNEIWKLCMDFQKNGDIINTSRLILVKTLQESRNRNQSLQESSKNRNSEVQTLLRMLLRLNKEDIENPPNPTEAVGTTATTKSTTIDQEVACRKLYLSFQNKIPEDTFYILLTLIKTIQYRYVLKFYGYYKVESYYNFVYEWAEKGDLLKLYENNYINWVTKLKIAYDVVRGLSYLQSANILHHSVKCENILIDGMGDAKVANFDKEVQEVYMGHRLTTLDKFVPWMAPEKLKAKGIEYDFCSEMFSYGMLLWELVYQKIPYKEFKVNDINDYVLSGKREVLKIGVKDREIQHGLIEIIKKELWKKYDIEDDNKADYKNYSVFIPKENITDELMQRYNIELESDFKII